MNGWRKAKASQGNSNCVEVFRIEDDVIVIRESDRPLDVITTSRANFAAFLAGVKAGEFDHLAVPATSEVLTEATG